MDISVIICTQNRCESLKDTLASLVRQESIKNIKYECIVVDNNSRDKTKEVVESYISDFKGKLRYIFEPNQGLSYARNRGVQEACGNIIAFTDDDCIVDKNWLLNIVHNFKAFNCDGIGGRVLPLYPESTPQWIKDNLSLLSGPIVYRDYGKGSKVYKNKSMDAFVGANMAYRKNCFRECGLFRTDLSTGRGFFGDDTEFFRRVEKNKKRLYYCGDVSVWHKHERKRMNYKYIAKWFFISGKTSIQENNREGLNEKYICYCGIPRTFIRSSMTRLLLFIINIFNRKNALRHWTMLFWALGQSHQYRKLNMYDKTK
jgi:glycosyltransferase involved in cell wall biosynthesis